MSVRLTRSNFNGPTLHSRLLKRDAQPAVVQKHVPTTIMKVPTDIDIFAPPESSDEEGERPQNSESTESSTKRKREDDHSLQAKRVKSSSQPTRKSGRGQAAGNDETIQEPQVSTSGFMDVFASFDDPASSQSSQWRKQKSTYGKSSQSSITRSSPSSNRQISIPKDPSFDSPKSRKKGFVSIASSPSKSLTFSPRKKLKQPSIEIPESSQPPVVQFTLPDDPSLDDSGGSSLSLRQNTEAFDVDDLPEATRRSRRGSTSSLSSVDSIASAYLSQTQKDDIRNGVESSQDIPPGYVQCPICKARVAHPAASKSIRSKSNPPQSPSKLSLRAQQAFCHTHRVATAKAQWIERKYPTIDWDDLEHRRIPTHIDHVRKVLFRKTPSVYLDQLDAAVKDAKGNTRKLNAYLIHQHNGHLATASSSSSFNKKGSTAKSITSTNGTNNIPSASNTYSTTQAYYGPQGHKLMSTILATTLSKQIRHTLKSDATARLAGVASFISAVLAPELCLRLVMEDLKSKKGGKERDGRNDSRDEEEEARRIMRESAEIGALVWPDEENISDDDEADGDSDEG